MAYQDGRLTWATVLKRVGPEGMDDRDGVMLAVQVVGILKENTGAAGEICEWNDKSNTNI